MPKYHANFEAWFRGQPAKQLSEAGYSGTELRDAKWQVLNAYTEKGIEGAEKEVKRLIDKAEGQSILKAIQDFYSMRRN